MSQPHDFGGWLVTNLADVDRILALVARRLGIGGDDAEEYASWAKARLCEDDFAILRKWRGESELRTYVVVVLTNLGREFRVQRWGRWRPSAAAVRLGPLAIRLETLVLRDGMRLDEAAALLRSRGETTETDRALAALLGQLPRRSRPERRDERDVPLEAISDDSSADDLVDAREREAEWRHVRIVLANAISRLDPEERLVIRLHFLQGLSLADVARTRAIPQKPLYRIKDRALARLATMLAAAGVTPEQLRELLGGALPDPGDEDEPPGAAAARRPVTPLTPGPHDVAPVRESLPPQRDLHAARPSNDTSERRPSNDGRGSAGPVRPGRSQP